MKEKIFLSASWEYLAMFNYVVDPAILHPYLPPYTEVELFNNKTIVSIVGFMFNNTRIAGIKWPGHTNFEEVNLRFYIKHFDGKRWKRGVAFVSEIVPRPIIAVTANLLYNEHYSTSKMFHNIRILHNELFVEYNWKKTNQKWNSMEIVAGTELKDIMPGSEEEFIFEHYFGYNQLKKNTTIEYAVEHPSWQVYPIHRYALKCDVKSLYGTSFVPFIEGITPESVFLANGSDVIVRKPLKITNGNVDPTLSKAHK